MKVYEYIKICLKNLCNQESKITKKTLLYSLLWFKDIAYKKPFLLVKQNFQWTNSWGKEELKDG